MKRVLIVGQDPQMCQSVSGTLAGLGFGVDVAYDSRTGVFLANRRDYSHFLVDDDIDNTGGVGVYEQLAAVQAGVVGILLTAAGNLNTVVSAIEAGIRRVLAKPVDYRQLIPLISAVSALSAGDDSELSKQRLAELSLEEIRSGMSDEQLIQIIRSVEYPFAGKERLEYFDRDTLERVVHLICRWCRQRLAA